MVDTNFDIRSGEDSLAYFQLLEKELDTFPSFHFLQQKYVELGEQLGVESDKFMKWKKNWYSLKEVLWPVDNASPDKKCTEKEKLQHIHDFIHSYTAPKSPKELLA